MKLPWQKTEQAAGGSTKVELPETAVAEKPAELPKGYTPPKGRPTPKRHDQEIARGVVRDPNARTPEQQRQKNKELKASMSKEEWKAYKKEQREANRAASREMQAKIDAGDERYLMDRDKGPERRFVRDWVDSRRFFNNYMMPLALVLLLTMFIGTWVPRVAGLLSLMSMVFILLIFIEAFIIGKRANDAVRQKFPDTSATGWGLGAYAWTRASQPRRLRTPKPQVPLGSMNLGSKR